MQIPMNCHGFYHTLGTQQNITSSQRQFGTLHSSASHCKVRHFQREQLSYLFGKAGTCLSRELMAVCPSAHFARRAANEWVRLTGPTRHYARFVLSCHSEEYARSTRAFSLQTLFRICYNLSKSNVELLT